MNTQWDLVIVGAGIAGYTAVKTVCETSPGTRVLLISEEDRLPYKRTNLSKYIARRFTQEQFQLQPAEWYQEACIDLRVKSKVCELDPQSHSLKLENGTQIFWRKLILATGASPTLPDSVHSLQHEAHIVRHAIQTERLIKALTPSVRHVLILGMGVLGVEVAEQLRLLNKEVTIVGNKTTIMPRHFPEHISEILKHLCQQDKITLIFDETVRSIHREAENQYTVDLQKMTLSSDLILVCAGAAPDVKLARQAGLTVNRGIVVNPYLQTSHQDIWAAGDVAEHPGGHITGLWHAAEFQGMLAARNALGEQVSYDQPPFRLKCEVFGHYFFSANFPGQTELSGYDAEESRDGERYACLYYQQDRLTSAIMLDDKPRAKLYERAVREGWSRHQITEALGDEV